MRTLSDIRRRSARDVGSHNAEPHPIEVVPFGLYGGGRLTATVGLVIVLGLVLMGLIGIPEARLFFAGSLVRAAFWTATLAASHRPMIPAFFKIRDLTIRPGGGAGADGWCYGYAFPAGDSGVGRVRAADDRSSPARRDYAGARRRTLRYLYFQENEHRLRRSFLAQSAVMAEAAKMVETSVTIAVDINWAPGEESCEMRRLGTAARFAVLERFSRCERGEDSADDQTARGAGMRNPSWPSKWRRWRKTSASKAWRASAHARTGLPGAADWSLIVGGEAGSEDSRDWQW